MSKGDYDPAANSAGCYDEAIRAIRMEGVKAGRFLPLPDRPDEIKERQEIRSGGAAVMSDVPTVALSVRQPWAWAIIYAGKDIENRSPGAARHMKTGRIAIHAAKGMTRDEYEGARDFMASIGVTCPSPHLLERGGIVGAVHVVDIVTQSANRWFFGPCGLVLRNAAACSFVPAKGALGYFKWYRGDASIVPAPARWMLPAKPAAPLLQGRLL